MFKTITKRLHFQHTTSPAATIAPGLLAPSSTSRFHTRTTHQADYYDKSQDRTILDPDRNEGTQSGTDSEVARCRSSYDPTKTTPESEMAASEEESRHDGRKGSPLNVSAANQEASRPRDLREGGPDRNVVKPGQHSKQGKSYKHGVVNQDKRQGR
ncbi:hypothetical protein PHISCL_08024 [Aspergillus sclerotialis]|uniref:Uncharacterized protein n=1 Tax=Aspergillus sclerotialis TaxID=2070753 RepID=A0A3A2Z964_9EURO|nr:hypothetical protein PHISCL_08024 [Aspergillus sclerotialis]